MIRARLPMNRLFLCLLSSLGAATPAAAKSFLSAYNIGLSYDLTSSYANLDYDADVTGKLPRDCVIHNDVAGKMRCTAYLVPDRAQGGSLFWGQRFQRQGLFYFDPGFTVSTLSYSGTVASKPKSAMGLTERGTKANSTSGSEEGSQPLTKVLLDLYGINWRSYLRVGITPRYVPDIFLTFGLGIQTVGGRVKVVRTDKMRWAVQPEGFGELEAVVLRAGSGSLSAFVSHEQTILGRYGSSLIEDNPNGSQLTNFKATLINAGSGIRLLFPF